MSKEPKLRVLGVLGGKNYFEAIALAAGSYLLQRILCYHSVVMTPNTSDPPNMTNLPPQSRQSRSVPPSQQTKLWGLAASRCAFPNCRNILLLPQTEADSHARIGQAAHIFAYSKDGPRPKPDDFPAADINKYENLILLCANHHLEVDAQPHKYTVEHLRQLKAAHESWISERLETQDFNSADLESIITWLADGPPIEPSTSVHLVAPEEKMQLNDFSPPVRRHVLTGLAWEPEVRTYVKDRAKLDTNYPERLLQPLLDRYSDFKTDGMSGDDIFVPLWQFTSGYSLDFNYKLAGLAVIMYFFLRCELFES